MNVLYIKLVGIRKLVNRKSSHEKGDSLRYTVEGGARRDSLVYHEYCKAYFKIKSNPNSLIYIFIKCIIIAKQLLKVEVKKR